MCLCCLFGITFSSCSDNDEKEVYDLRTYLIGDWKYDVNSTITFTFKSDGTGISHYAIDSPFKWTLEGNVLSITHNKDSYLDNSGEVKIIGKNKMKWNYLTYTRIGEYQDPSDPKDPSKPDKTEDFAPASLTGKIIRFDEWLANGGGSTGDDNRIQFYTEHDMRANWASLDSSYTYTKTGKNTGHLNFICSFSVNYVTRVFRYDITLTFKDSEGNFELSGTKDVTGGISGNGVFKIIGKGSYWDRLWK